MSTLASDHDGSLTTQLALPRPQTRREWAGWYARLRAARVRLEAEPDGAVLVDAYGLDAATITATVARWGGPHLPGPLLDAWFGPDGGRP